MVLLYDSIERFPQAHYEIHMGWNHLEDWLKQQAETGIPGSGLDLDPDFQRAHVWTPEQQVSYVEFILQGGESSRLLYWNHPNWMSNFKGYLTLVDGKQRLEAVRAFLRNEVPAFGHTLKDMEPRFLSKVDAHFMMRIAKLKTRKDILKWYLMINAGGTPHTKKELDRVRKLLEAEK
jgi:hypothetical protein